MPTQQSSSQSLNTGTSNYLIPGASPTYTALSGQMGSLYGALSGQAQGLVDQYGRTEEQQLQNQYAQAGAQQQQGLLNRGLGNTTVANSIQTGLNQSQALAQTNLGEQTAQLRMNALGQFDLPALANQGQLGSQYLGLVGQQGTYNTSQNQSGNQMGLSSQPAATGSPLLNQPASSGLGQNFGAQQAPSSPATNPYPGSTAQSPPSNPNQAFNTAMQSGNSFALDNLYNSQINPYSGYIGDVNIPYSSGVGADTSQYDYSGAYADAGSYA